MNVSIVPMSWKKKIWIFFRHKDREIFLDLKKKKNSWWPETDSVQIIKASVNKVVKGLGVSKNFLNCIHTTHKQLLWERWKQYRLPGTNWLRWNVHISWRLPVILSSSSSHSHTVHRWIKSSSSLYLAVCNKICPI